VSLLVLAMFGFGIVGALRHLPLMSELPPGHRRAQGAPDGERREAERRPPPGTPRAALGFLGLALLMACTRS
jgi:hypothetical protein